MEIGTVLKQELKRQKITQKDIAKAVGVSNNTISSICRNERMPTKKLIKKICDYLNVEIRVYIVDKQYAKDILHWNRVTIQNSAGFKH